MPECQAFGCVTEEGKRKQEKEKDIHYSRWSGKSELSLRWLNNISFSLSNGEQSAHRHHSLQWLSELVLVSATEFEPTSPTVAYCDSLHNSSSRYLSSSSEYSGSKRYDSNPKASIFFLQDICSTLRKRKQVHRKHQEERLAKDERSKMQKELDKVIATEMKAKEKKKTDAELQKEIDSTLSEVRQKKRDMTQQQNLYRALRKLRLIRQGTMSNSSSHQDGENFESAMTKLEEFVRQRSTMYREEEKTMQVMLEGERTEMVAKEDERTLRKKAIAEEARLKLQKEMLFGEGTLAENASEWNPISRFYNQANENLQCFIDVRRQWDAFISEDQQDATRIPLNWISPAPPSSDKWASAIS
ncbi:Programmed cell death protein 7 [Apostichopus japonicus]|uniref:Programmed cell death protein 7 n=1 Tax=Stichopus japonicus TaxID=307972 RepID=A0A2G8KW85_STIJA|nr:Programmed cell death protein 7 [Apostichopus japonicus]